MAGGAGGQVQNISDRNPKNVDPNRKNKDIKMKDQVQKQFIES